MYAIVRTGGKQYRVETGDVIHVERLSTPEGEAVRMEDVLLVADDEGGVRVGAPKVEGSAVVTEGRAGALITRVIEGTGAAAAGLEIDDVIISVDGVEIQSHFELGAQIRVHRPGDVIDLIILRDGGEMTITVTLGERPEDAS